MIKTTERFRLALWMAALAALMGGTSFFAAAKADGTSPQQMPISLKSPTPPPQNGIILPYGNGNTWSFQIVPTGQPFRWVDGPHWQHPGNGSTFDPVWGTFSPNPSDGSLSLSWISGTGSESFSVSVTGKIVPIGGGGGGTVTPVDIAASWSGHIVAKDWKAEPAIDGGIMLQPQNQTDTPADPAMLLVAKGATIGCGVSKATDKDTWTQGSDTGQEDDTVNYKWTASGGGFVTAEHPNGDAPEALTQSAQWKAPDDPGDYSLQCVVDDKPTEVKDPDTGTRDDPSVTRKVEVKVVEIKFVPTVVYMYPGDTRDISALVTPEEVTSLLTFSMLDTSTATLAGQAPEMTVHGVAPGSTKLQATYDGKVLAQLSVVVRDTGDNDLDGDGIPNDQDSDADGDGIPDVPVQRTWTPGSGISGGQFGVDEVQVAADGSVDLSVSQATDSDHWRKGINSDDASDTVTYSWSSSGGSVTKDATEPWKSTFAAPSQSGDYYVQLWIDDAPAAVTAPDEGSRDDSAVTRTLKIIVLPKIWDTDLAIGKHRLTDGTVVDDGRITSPQDQRQQPYLPDPVVVEPGRSLTLSVETATDSDHWKQGTDEGYEDDTVNYTWSAPAGVLTPSDGKAQSVTWKAPSDEGTYALTCTIDDKPNPIGEYEKGTRDDKAITRTVNVKVQLFNISWQGLARACAGGIGTDGVHDFTITGTATHSDGTAVANAVLELSFENNRGHDYSSDPAGIKPDGWTTDDTKRAKFVTVGGQEVQEMNLTTNADGTFNVHVLSSDIISSDIKVKVKWKDMNGKEHDVGEKVCEFASTMSLRRFGLIYYPNEEDNGWIFGTQNNPNSKQLIAYSGTTPAKVYLKFQINPDIARDTNYFNPDGTPREHLDDDGNWDFVNGHRLIIRIKKIEPQDGVTFDGVISDYATLIDSNDQPISEVVLTTSNDGAAQVMIKPGPLIRQAQEVILSAADITEHLN